MIIAKTCFSYAVSDLTRLVKLRVWQETSNLWWPMALPLLMLILKSPITIMFSYVLTNRLA